MSPMPTFNVLCAVALSRWGHTAAAGGDDLVDRLAVHFPTASRSSLQSAAADGLAEALSVENVPLSEADCARDYSLPCPEAWVDGGDGQTCLAPLGYVGACAGTLRFDEASTPETKRRQAFACDAQFPCKGACTPDFGAMCPSGWLSEGDGCVAPAGYTGSCVGRKSFNGFSSAEKALWADRCGVSWPCRSAQGRSSRMGGGASLRRARACTEDLSVECPQGWHKLGANCVAPLAYAGPCPSVASFSNLTSMQKQLYSDICQSQWPCAAALRR